MLRSIKELQGYTLHAVDGDIGTVHEFYFDDARWVIRYLVVDTGGWLSGRRVLISPIAIGEADWQARSLSVTLSREQVEHSPDIDADKPISRQREVEYYQYYGWPYYWAGPGLWGAGMYPYVLAVPPVTPATAAQGEQEQPEQQEQGDPHLRSTKEVLGYRIAARDGEIGHVEDFVVDDEAWVIRWMVVDTGNWLPGRKVLVSSQWITEVRWETTRVHVDLARETIERSPEFDPSTPVNREYEARLYDYYGRPVYWR